MTAGSSAHNAK